MTSPIKMEGVREYAESMDVELSTTNGMRYPRAAEEQWSGRGRLVILAWNEAGHNRTEVDLLDVIAWVKANKPELLTIE